MTTNVDLKVITAARLTQVITARYSGNMPVSLSVTDSLIMSGVDVKIGVEGASRTIHLSPTQLLRYQTIDGQDAVEEEVLYAAFLLLDENEDEV